MTDPVLIGVAAFLAGAFLAALIVFVLTTRRANAAREELSRTKGDLREAAVKAGQADDIRAKLDQSEARLHQAEKDLESLRSRAEEREKAHQEKVETLIAFRQDMEKEFKTLADQALEKQSRTFAETNQEKVQMLLNPLREQIKNFETAFQKDGHTRTEQTTTLRHMFEQLEKQTGQISKEATDLTNALKGSTQQQGAWGEMILETILEKSGLREGEEFVTQNTAHTAEDGTRLRPDVVVNLPNEQKLVIDSKVSLLSFERCVNCEEEAERNAHLKSHINSVRNHIKGLSAKDYAQLYGGVDFVVLFVPIESALSLAIQHDSEIQSYAASNNVMIASPNTLLMALRTVQNLWRIENQNRHAQEIASRAGALYEKFAGFAEDLEKVGLNIDRARNAYDDARKKLSTGRGNLVRQAEMLKEMGAETSKSLPDKLTALSHHEDGEEDANEAGALPGGEDT